MPVEIRELTIRARVEPSRQEEPQNIMNANADENSGNDTDIARLIDEQLKRQKER